MNIPDTVKTYLATKGGEFKIRVADVEDDFNATLAMAKLASRKVAKAVLIKSGKAYLMAVIPADRELDFSMVNRMFKREFEFCNEADIQELFPNCDPNYLPPLAEAYGLKAVQDKNLNELEYVYFASGEAGTFIRAGAADFKKLQGSAWRKHEISTPHQKSESEIQSLEELRMAIKDKVQSVKGLPPMPGIAAEIIRLRNNPYAMANELAAVIEQDPSLSAQLIRYATSPLYAYQGKVESVEHAIVRVLGMDFVFDLAFGLSLGRSFRIEKSGPVGLDNFWQHAIHTATLVQNLCGAIEYSRRPPPGMGYLTGLLHNFGFLLLGHLFPEQFARLNRAIEANPDRSVLDVERETIGVTHTELGLWLMDAWEMPREIIEAVREHHNAKHSSDYSIYANLIYIANALLKRIDIGDSEVMDVDDALLERVHLSREQVEAVFANVMDDTDGMEFIASKMAA